MNTIRVGLGSAGTTETTLTLGDGVTPIDLTAATVHLKLLDPNTYVEVYDIVCTSASPTLGIVQFELDPLTHTSTRVMWVARWTIQNDTGTIVVPDVGEQGFWVY